MFDRKNVMKKRNATQRKETLIKGFLLKLHFHTERYLLSWMYNQVVYTMLSKLITDFNVTFDWKVFRFSSNCNCNHRTILNCYSKTEIVIQRK